MTWQPVRNFLLFNANRPPAASQTPTLYNSPPLYLRQANSLCTALLLTIKLYDQLVCCTGCTKLWKAFRLVEHHQHLRQRADRRPIIDWTPPHLLKICLQSGFWFQCWANRQHQLYPTRNFSCTNFYELTGADLLSQGSLAVSTAV